MDFICDCHKCVNDGANGCPLVKARRELEGRSHSAGLDIVALFIAHLVDHHEGEKITEEFLLKEVAPIINPLSFGENNIRSQEIDFLNELFMMINKSDDVDIKDKINERLNQLSDVR